MTWTGGHHLRTPPANLAAEQALLGALLANSDKAYQLVSEFLRPEHFADAAHRAVFAAIQRRCEAGQAADVVTLRPELENHDDLHAAGGGKYLPRLLSAMVGISNAGEYGREVFTKFQCRELLSACNTAAEHCYGSEGVEPRGIIEALDAALLKIAEGRAGEDLRDSAAIAEQGLNNYWAAMQRRGALAGVTTGYKGLDRMTGGLKPGEMIVCGARPSMGKTALAAGIAARAAVAGHKVLFVSAEMLAWGVMARCMAAVANLPVSAILRGGSVDRGSGSFEPFTETSPETAAVTEAARRLSSLSLWWDQEPMATVAGIRSRARRLKRRHGLDLIVVDYLGRCRGTPEATRLGKVAEVTEMSSHFKALAMELEVPLLLLSQLNRGNEGREDPRPRLSDLRDSGAIEQDADQVWFLHREHYYLKRARPAKKPREKQEDFDGRVNEWYAALQRTVGLADLDIAKQRQGPIGPVHLLFQDETTWFRDRDEDREGPAIPGL